MNTKTKQSYTGELFLVEDYIEGSISSKEFHSQRFPYLITELVAFLNNTDFPTGKDYKQFRDNFLSNGTPDTKPEEVKPVDSPVNHSVIDYHISSLLGKVLTIIDATISSPSQCKALKDVIKGNFSSTRNRLSEIAIDEFKACTGATNIPITCTTVDKIG